MRRHSPLSTSMHGPAKRSRSPSLDVREAPAVLPSLSRARHRDSHSLRCPDLRTDATGEAGKQWSDPAQTAMPAVGTRTKPRWRFAKASNSTLLQQVFAVDRQTRPPFHSAVGPVNLQFIDEASVAQTEVVTYITESRAAAAASFGKAALGAGNKFKPAIAKVAEKLVVLEIMISSLVCLRIDVAVRNKQFLPAVVIKINEARAPFQLLVSGG